MPLFGKPNIRKLKDRRDIPRLLKALDYEKNENIRHSAVEALGELRVNESAQPLLDLLGKDDFDNKEVIISALGKIGNEKAILPLVERIKLQNASSSPLELTALRSIGASAVKSLLALLEDKTTDTKDASAILDCLEEIGGEEARNGLIHLLSPNRSSLIPHLSAMIVRLADKEVAISTLVSALKSGPAETWSVHIISALRQLDWRPADIKENAALAVADRDWEGIKKMAEPAKDFILPLLQKGRASDIVQATTVLGEIGGNDSVELVAGLLEDRRPDVVTAAVHALGQMGSGQAVHPLIQLLSETNSTALRDKSQQALLKIGEPAVEPLIGQLNSMDPQERRTAVRILGEIGDRSALPFLLSARNDPALHQEIDSALEKLGWQPPDQES